MTPERWQKVKELFEAAQDRPAAERAAFLAHACDGDDELSHEVESLLAASEKEGSFIDSPAYAAAATLLVDDAAEMKSGETIGAYEIASFINRGGMGEVYLAHDRRLGRKVALKILPSSFTRNQERLRRFEQEARAASALNHPNIITIYEILKSESTHIIATEFVEGQTLRQRLARSRIELAESLDVAIQVSDALAAAHAAGIVHRDIKPENIMLRPDGYVKVLDFGLAKLAEAQANVAAEEAVTKQVRTGSGVVMGTAGYMSPEQARGKSVDARSDIFSLGAVIYEMFTHIKPFDGETPSDVLASILTTDPPPLTQFVAGAPPELERIVTKALRKNRDERYQSIRDLWTDLKALKQDLEFEAKLQSATSATGAEGSGGQFPLRRSAAAEQTVESPGVTSISQAFSIGFKRRPFALSAAIVLPIVLLAAVAFGVYKFISRPQPIHFQTTRIARLTNSGKVIDARLSRDGTYLLYVLSDAGKQSLWIRNVTTANDKMILSPAPVGFFGITFSPDGRDLYYAMKQNYDPGTLYRIPILGGTPVKLLEKIDGPVTFSPDGKRMAFVRANFPAEDQSALIVVNVDGTSEQSLVTKKKPERLAPIFFTGSSWSPDGKLIASSVLTVGGVSRVVAFPVDGGSEINLSQDGWPFSGHVEWMPDMSGLLVVAGSNSAAGAQLWFLSYPSGEKRQITNDLNQHRALGLAADGSRFVTVVSNSLVTVWVAADGDASRAVQLPTGNVGFGAPFGSVTWTAAGKIIFSSAEGTEVNIWTMDSDGQNRTPLTSNAGRNLDPAVSPDDRYVVFSSTRATGQNIWRMNIDGSNPKQLTQGVAETSPTISPDGQWVLYSALGTTRPTIWKVPIDGGTPVEVTHRVGSGPAFSPDGKLIAYLYPEGPDPLVTPSRIALMPFEGGEPVATFAFSPATAAKPIIRWAADGQSILYMSTTNNVTNIWSQPIKGGPPVQVTNFKDHLMTGFAWSQDNKTLVCARGVFTRDAVLITDAKPAG